MLAGLGVLGFATRRRKQKAAWIAFISGQTHPATAGFF